MTLPHFNSNPSLVPSALFGEELDFRGKIGLSYDWLSFLPDCGPGLALPGPVYGEAVS